MWGLAVQTRRSLACRCTTATTSASDTKTDHNTRWAFVHLVKRPQFSGLLIRSTPKVILNSTIGVARYSRSSNDSFSLHVLSLVLRL
jgi:hypothetical protein